MVDTKMNHANSAPVIVNNSEKSSDILCISCAELDLELEETRIELRATQQFNKAKLTEAMRDEFGQVIYNCSMCLEFGNKLQHTLSELKSLQLVNKLLFKELEEISAKFEVMTAKTLNEKSDKSQNDWRDIEFKTYRNIRRNSELKGIDTPYFPLATNNRYDILSNLIDYATNEDVSSSLKETYCEPTLKETNRETRDKEPILISRNNTKGKQIPVIVNGEIVTNKCDNLIPFSSTTHNSLNKINNSNYKALKNKGKKDNNHNIVILGDSHSKGIATKIDDYLGNKFQVHGIVKPGASIADIITQCSRKYMNLTKEDVIVIQGG
jgi:hypothetical protein